MITMLWTGAGLESVSLQKNIVKTELNKPEQIQVPWENQNQDPAWSSQDPAAGPDQRPTTRVESCSARCSVSSSGEQTHDTTCEHEAAAAQGH